MDMSKYDEMIDRVLEMLRTTKDTNYRIAKTTGISETAIGRYKRGISRPTVANAKIMLQYFMGADLDFTSKDARAVDEVQFMQVPFVPVPAQAGYLRGYGDLEYIDQLPTLPVLVDRNYKGKYRVFEISGDSMDDGTTAALCDGDKVLCREVPRDLWDSRLPYRHWYFVIVCRSEGITVKQITNENMETGDIRCHPLNPLFNDFTLNLDRDVLELYNVVKIVDRNARI